jgi:hypothetical protein
MMGGEVDIRDCSRMRVENMLDRVLPGFHSQVPYESLLVGSADYPGVARTKWRPLDIGDLPWCAMGKITGRRVGVVQVYDMQTFLSIIQLLISSGSETRAKVRVEPTRRGRHLSHTEILTWSPRAVQHGRNCLRQRSGCQRPRPTPLFPMDGPYSQDASRITSGEGAGEGAEHLREVASRAASSGKQTQGRSKDDSSNAFEIGKGW